jgi:hypothetical protein
VHTSKKLSVVFRHPSSLRYDQLSMHLSQSSFLAAKDSLNVPQLYARLSSDEKTAD